MLQANNIQAFLELVRAGLWEKDAQLLPLGDVDFDEVYQFASEQSVIGLITAGFDHLIDVKAPQELVLQCIGESLQMEQSNTAMNLFIESLVSKMREADIYTLLVKGQGIAQCYERPMWRSCGDVDFFLNGSNYEKAKEYLVPMASSIEPEGIYKKHFEMTIDPWVVELHGSMRCGLSAKMDKGIDDVQKAVFYGGNVRSWTDGRTQVFLPSPDNDAIFIFTHYLKHFYTGGLGLRQICDWCRLLWTYRESLNRKMLESRIRKMELMSEWKAFGAFAVVYLGMPSEAMPLYSPETKWKRKADKISAFIIKVGNMGHNRDMSYYDKYPYLLRKIFSMGRRFGDLIRHAQIFPLDSFRFFPSILFNGLRSAARGE